MSKNYMEERLAELISDYQASIVSAVRQMSESGIEIPSSSNAWIDLKIPVVGQFTSGIKYYKHGRGCEVYLSEGAVDFDFGREGQIDGFDQWRLWSFCQRRGKNYAFESERTLHDCFKHAVEVGQLINSSHNLYYVVDSVKSLGREAARILTAGCALPHPTRDSVQTLSAQCFDSADLMFEHYRVVDQQWIKSGHLSHQNGLKFRVYVLSWLGYLHTTAEGFRDLNMRLHLQYKRPEIFQELISKCDEIGRLEKKHYDDLRVLRNDVFHLRTNDEAVNEFFSDDGERMTWAKELHAAFAEFFSNYRVLAEFYYLHSGRYGESQMRQESMKRRRKKTENSIEKVQAKA